MFQAASTSGGTMELYLAGVSPGRGGQGKGKPASEFMTQGAPGCCSNTPTGGEGIPPNGL